MRIASAQLGTEGLNDHRLRAAETGGVNSFAIFWRDNGHARQGKAFNAGYNVFAA